MLRGKNNCFVLDCHIQVIYQRKNILSLVKKLKSMTFRGEVIILLKIKLKKLKMDFLKGVIFCILKDK